MKAPSLTQPWASLVSVGAKRIETRSWYTDYRGPLAIHAAKGFPAYAREMCRSRVVKEALGWEAPWVDWKTVLPLGAVIATCRIVDCLPVESWRWLPALFEHYPHLDTPQERAFGLYEPEKPGERRWGWVLEDVRETAIQPARGALGLWEWIS